MRDNPELYSDEEIADWTRKLRHTGKSEFFDLKRVKVVGARCSNNYFWTLFIFSLGLGFSLAGLSSFCNINLLPFSNPKELTFFPQGLLLLFYGSLNLGASFYNIYTIIIDFGSGYNEYNRIQEVVKIVRKGFPDENQNQNILLTYSLVNSVRAIGIKITGGLNPTRSLYLCLLDGREIPLTSTHQLPSISDLEEQAAELAEFLSLSINTL